MTLVHTLLIPLNDLQIYLCVWSFLNSRVFNARFFPRCDYNMVEISEECPSVPWLILYYDFGWSFACPSLCGKLGVSMNFILFMYFIGSLWFWKPLHAGYMYHEACQSLCPFIDTPIHLILLDYTNPLCRFCVCFVPSRPWKSFLCRRTGQTHANYIKFN